MKKVCILILVLALTCSLFVGCNRTFINTTYNFDEAVVNLSDGTVIRGQVDNWKDWKDSDMIQVTVDGVTYYTHSLNVVLIAH